MLNPYTIDTICFDPITSPFGGIEYAELSESLDVEVNIPGLASSNVAFVQLSTTSTGFSSPNGITLPPSFVLPPNATVTNNTTNTIDLATRDGSTPVTDGSYYYRVVVAEGTSTVTDFTVGDVFGPVYFKANTGSSFPPNVNITPFNPQICDGDPVQLTAAFSSTPSDPNWQIQWQNAPGLNITSPTTATATAGGTYEVLISNSGSACSTGGSGTESVTVDESNSPNVVPTIAATGVEPPFVHCNGNGLELFVSNAAAFENSNFSWYRVNATGQDFFDGFSAFNFIPDFGNFYVIYENDCGQIQSATVLVEAGQSPPKPTISISDGSLLSTNAPGYIWLDSSQVEIPGATNQVFTPSEPGVYYVQTTDEFGCVSPISDPVLVTTVSRDALLAEHGLSIYPTPAYDVLKVVLEQPLAADAKLMLYDVNGKLIQTAQLPKGQAEHVMDLSAVAAGNYLLQVQSEMGNASFRVIKMK